MAWRKESVILKRIRVELHRWGLIFTDVLLSTLRFLPFPPFKFHKRSSHCTLNTSTRRCNIERRKAMERVSRRRHRGCDRPVKVDVKRARICCPLKDKSTFICCLLWGSPEIPGFQNRGFDSPSQNCSFLCPVAQTSAWSSPFAPFEAPPAPPRSVGGKHDTKDMKPSAVIAFISSCHACSTGSLWGCEAVKPTK